MKRIFILLNICFLLITAVSESSWAWFDKTHIAVAKEAGCESWYNAAGADITVIKAGALERKNHYFDNNNQDVTNKMVLDQADKYNNPNDEAGHLYGAIISSLRDYRNFKTAGKFAEHHLAFAVHYIGDLSQPLHNISYDDFNKAHHLVNDGIVESEVFENVKEIKKNMYKIELRSGNFDEDLASQIARIANISCRLAQKMRAENRDLSKKEAYTQLGHSASLLRAVLKSSKEIYK
jgi:hypothetical protein